MSAARKLLLFGGAALALFGMLYGLHYAVFIEHQTLESMGGSLDNAFMDAADRKLPEAHSALANYASSRYNYVRQVDVHSHWIGLAMLMMVLGVVFDSVAFEQRLRFWLALSLLVGAVIFPLGVILQTQSRSGVGSALAIAGSVLVIASLAAVAFGFVRQN